MNEFYFNDIWRMDWGFGNPNKTASLIAMLMLAVWGLVFIKRWGFWVALLLFTGLGVCLVHTFSRGGIVALFFGIASVLWMAWCYRISKIRIIGIVVAVWVIIGSAIGFQAHQRYTQGIIQEDRSITNRLAIWEMAPQMMRDAPSGWGIGNSGNAYCQWYQPLDRTEEYRTLVNSHLTWLVELGWWGRFAYLLGWLLVLMVCLPTRKQPWLAIPLGIWLIFGISAVFSSVAESRWLWVLPLVSLVSVVTYRTLSSQWLDKRFWVCPPSLAALVLTSILSWPSPPTNFPIQYLNEVIYIGNEDPEALLLYNRELFGNGPGRAFRQAMSERQNVRFALMMDFRDIPTDGIERLVIGGNLPQESLDKIRGWAIEFDSVNVINPAFYPGQLFRENDLMGKVNVSFGEFYYQGPRSAWDQAFPEKVSTLQGVGAYIPNWPEMIIKPASSEES